MMLSRVADSLYWIGRYAERIETNTHILYTQLDTQLERNGASEADWEKVVKVCGYIDDYKARYTGFTLEEIHRYFIFDEQNFNSLAYMVSSVRSNAKNARDIIPNELWEEWNEYYLALQNGEFARSFSVLNTTAMLTRLRKTTLTATGVIDSLMTRDVCFMFLKIGKWIERSEKTALIVHTLLSDAQTAERDFAVGTGLQMTHALEEYNRRFRNRQPDEVLNFLMGDLQCTRSVAYGLNKMKKTVLDIENGEIRQYAADMFRAIEELTYLVQVDATSLSVEERLEWIDDIRQKITNFGPIFSKTYYLTAPILVD